MLISSISIFLSAFVTKFEMLTNQENSLDKNISFVMISPEYFTFLKPSIWIDAKSSGANEVRGEK